MGLLHELLCNKGVVQLGLPSLNETVSFCRGVNVLPVLRKDQCAEVLIVLRVMPVANRDLSLGELEVFELSQLCDPVVLMLGGTVELGKFKLDVHCARLRESAERVKLRHNSFFAKSIFELLRCCRLSRSLKYKTKCNNPTSQIKTSLYMAGAWNSKNCAHSTICSWNNALALS